MKSRAPRPASVTSSLHTNRVAIAILIVLIHAPLRPFVGNSAQRCGNFFATVRGFSDFRRLGV